jgi:hypothetical protein
MTAKQEWIEERVSIMFAERDDPATTIEEITTQAEKLYRQFAALPVQGKSLLIK